MVDFRYHLVSLVSVFLALAVGIILGAGPLQNAIGDTLSNRVEALRASRDDAREKFDAANASSNPRTPPSRRPANSWSTRP